MLVASVVRNRGAGRVAPGRCRARDQGGNRAGIRHALARGGFNSAVIWSAV